MSEQGDDLVRAGIRRGFELFNDRNWDALARAFPDDFEAFDHVPPDSRRAEGPYALREITDANGDTAFADLQMEAVEIEILRRGERLLAVVRIAARASGGASAVPIEGEIAQLWTYEGGRPTRFEQFRSWDDALAAAAN